MTPTALQIFATLFALFAMSRVFLRLKEHQLEIREALFWTLIWAGMLTVVWVPATANLISTTLGLETSRPVDTIIYVGMVLLFYLVYRMHAKHEKLQQEFTRLVRLVSIKESEQAKRR